MAKRWVLLNAVALTLAFLGARFLRVYQPRATDPSRKGQNRKRIL